MFIAVAIFGFASALLVWLGMTTAMVTFRFMEMKVDPEGVRSRGWLKSGWITPTRAVKIIRLYEASGERLRILHANRIAGTCVWIGLGGFVVFFVGMCTWMTEMRS